MGADLRLLLQALSPGEQEDLSLAVGEGAFGHGGGVGHCEFELGWVGLGCFVLVLEGAVVCVVMLVRLRDCRRKKKRE